MKRWLFLVFISPSLLFANMEKKAEKKKETSESRVQIFTEGNKKEVLVNGKMLSQLKSLSFSEGNYLLETKQAPLKIKIDNSLKIKMGENTKVHLDVSRSSSMGLNHVYGKIQISGSASNLLVYQIENLFSFPVESGEMVVEHDSKDKHSKFSSLGGEQKIQIAGDDRIQILKEGQFLEFTPEWSDGEMVYDFLLNNKKIPKFHISQGAVQGELKTNDSEWKFVEVSKKPRKTVFKKEELSSEQIKQKISETKEHQQICKQPKASFSECVWGKENKKCVRYTCNLNGEWAQKTEFTLTAECPDKRTLKSCEWLR